MWPITGTLPITSTFTLVHVASTETGFDGSFARGDRQSVCPSDPDSELGSSGKTSIARRAVDRLSVDMIPDSSTVLTVVLSGVELTVRLGRDGLLLGPTMVDSSELDDSSAWYDILVG